MSQPEGGRRTTERELSVNAIPNIQIFNSGDVEVTVGEVISGRITKINGLNLDSLKLSDRDYFELFKSVDVQHITISNDGSKEKSRGIYNDSYEIMYIMLPDGPIGVQVTSNNKSILAAASSSTTIQCNGLYVTIITEEHQKIQGQHLRVGDIIVMVNGVSLTNLSVAAATEILSSSTSRRLVIMREKNKSLTSANSDLIYTKSNIEIPNENIAATHQNRKSVDTDATDSCADSSYHHDWKDIKNRYLNNSLKRKYRSPSQVDVDSFLNVSKSRSIAKSSPMSHEEILKRRFRRIESTEDEVLVKSSFDIDEED